MNAITSPPTVPSRNRPGTFSPEMDAMLDWFAISTVELNNLAMGQITVSGVNGWGGTGNTIFPATSIDEPLPAGVYTINGDTTTGSLPPSLVGVTGGNGHALMLRMARADFSVDLLFRRFSTPEFSWRRSRISETWRTIRDSVNTVVDGNGFIKEASPVLRLANDGLTEPSEPVGATFARLGVGHYTVGDTQGLAQEGWQIEIPRDHNGNRLVAVDTEWSGGVLTVLVGEPVWDDGRIVRGAPVDVPAGRWIDLRMHTGANDE